MATTPVLPKLVGTRVKRREDPRLIQGRATYVDDVKIAGMQHIAFKRCDIAHGRIRSVDVTAAAAMEGVEAVFTGAQIATMLEPLPIATPFPSPPHRAVAVDVVRYAGEPVAVVVARNRYIARDAADADHLVLGDRILQAAGLDDCEHRFSFVFMPRCSDRPDRLLSV